MTKKHLTYIALLSLAATMVLHTSMLSRQQEDRLADLNRQIAAEENRIRILTAEWHSLKTPERLEKLAQRHLPEYVTIKPTQMASLFDVPEKALVSEMPAVAEAKPAPAAAVVKPAQVAKATPPVAAKPVTVAAAKPTRAAAPAAVAVAPKQDDLALLIAANDKVDDGIRTIIERDTRHTAPGVVRASFER